MKKILLFCIIIFVVPVFSMDEGIGKLFEAVESKDIEKIKEVIFKYPNLSDIAWAISPNLRNGKNIIDFAVEIAEESKNPEIEQMVRWGISTYSEQKEFFEAVQKGKIDEIKSLLSKGDPRYLNVNATNYEGDTPLMIVVKNGNIDLARELLRLGASIDGQRNKKGQTALTLAIISKNSKMVTTLLNSGEEVAIDLQDAEENTPFILAMQNYNKGIIEALLPEVPDPSIENKKGETAEKFATLPEQKELLALAQGRFNLFSAIEKGKATKEDIEKLIASELSTPNALKNITSMTRNPLAQAIVKDKFDIVELLVQKGADVNQKFTFGLTPLLIAVDAKNFKIAEFLLKKGADQKAVFISRDGTSNITLLMVVAERGDVDIAKMLLAAGVDPLLKDSEGKTALEYAQKQISSKYTSDQEKNNFNEVINLLLPFYIQHFTEALNMLQGALVK